MKQGYHIYNLPTLFTNAKPIHNESKTPMHFKLLQNYPNPFNPSTIIKYDLNQSSKATLKIYNLAGQELETLINEDQLADEKEGTWQPKGLPGRIYFCILQAGEFSETKKCILQKLYLFEILFMRQF